MVAERPDTSTGDGDHERFAHYVKKDKIVESAVTGAPVIALCGKVWVPGRDPQKFPVCPDCKRIYDGHPRPRQGTRAAPAAGRRSGGPDPPASPRAAPLRIDAEPRDVPAGAARRGRACCRPPYRAVTIGVVAVDDDVRLRGHRRRHGDARGRAGARRARLLRVGLQRLRRHEPRRHGGGGGVVRPRRPAPAAHHRRLAVRRSAPLLAGAAWSMPVLVGARVLQGLGGGIGDRDGLRRHRPRLPRRAAPRPSRCSPRRGCCRRSSARSSRASSPTTCRGGAVFWLVVPFVLPPLLLLSPRLARLGGSARRRPAASRPGAARARRGARPGAAAGGGHACAAPSGIVLARRRARAARSRRCACCCPAGCAALRARPADRGDDARRCSPARSSPARRSSRSRCRPCGASSTAQAGLVLTVGAIGWALGSQAQGRLYGRVAARPARPGRRCPRRARASPPCRSRCCPRCRSGLAAVSWFVGALGMGLCFGAIAHAHPRAVRARGPGRQLRGAAGVRLRRARCSSSAPPAPSTPRRSPPATVSARTFTDDLVADGGDRGRRRVLAARIGRPTLGATAGRPRRWPAPGRLTAPLVSTSRVVTRPPPTPACRRAARLESPVL